MLHSPPKYKNYRERHFSLKNSKYCDSPRFLFYLNLYYELTRSVDYEYEC